MPNDDGFEPGQRVEFDEINRAERLQRRKQQAATKPAQTLYARHKGGPWYRVTDESGAVISESMRRHEAEQMGAVVVAK